VKVRDIIKNCEPVDDLRIYIIETQIFESRKKIVLETDPWRFLYINPKWTDDKEYYYLCRKYENRKVENWYLWKYDNELRLGIYLAEVKEFGYIPCGVKETKDIINKN
jgi:hypothetical protein